MRPTQRCRISVMMVSMTPPAATTPVAELKTDCWLNIDRLRCYIHRSRLVVRLLRIYRRRPVYGATAEERRQCQYGQRKLDYFHDWNPFHISIEISKERAANFTRGYIYRRLLINFPLAVRGMNRHLPNVSLVSRCSIACR